jgi:hypothetical protein
LSVLQTTDFSGTDADPIGGIWSTVTGSSTWKRVSNDAQPSSSTSDSVAYENTVTWPNDQYAKAIIGTAYPAAVAGDGLGVGVRWATGSITGYEVTTGTAGAGTTINKRNAGFSILASVATSFTATDEIYLEIQGSSLVAKKNGATFSLSASDSAIASGKATINLSGELTSACSLSSWEGGDFAGGVSVVPVITRQFRERWG